MAIKGIDISYWQGKKTVAELQQAKADGVNFVITRLGYNANLNIDSTFENNYANIKAAGLDVGVYYYSTARTVAQAQAEAQFCLKYLAGKSLNYPVFIDIEDDDTSGQCSRGTLAAVAKAFCATIEASGFKSGVYASLDWLRNKIGDISGLNIWVAQYNDVCNWAGAKVMWQYSSKGKVAGFSGNIDMNYCYTSEFAANTSSSSPSTSTVVPTSGMTVKEAIAYGQKMSNEILDTEIDEDGVWGPQTKANCIKMLQWAMNKDYNAGLHIDGKYGILTSKALGDHYVCQGETQYMVTALETMLYMNGYNPKGVEIPGTFGSGCAKATAVFQEDAKLAVDIIAGRKTFVALIA